MMRRFSYTKWDGLIVFSLTGLVIAHYSVPQHVLWVHMVLFWVYQIPILIGGITRGVRGGVTTAVIASLLLLPHALGLSRHHGLSANTIWTDLINLYVIGLATGWLRDRWRLEQERGDRVRDLRNLQRVLQGILQDLRPSIPALRGLVTSLEPLRGRVPALVPAVQAMDRALTPVETLIGRLEVLQVESKIGLVRMDRILGAMASQLRRIGEPVPSVSIDWQCRPPVIPACPATLSGALAALVLQVAPGAAEVQITITKAPGRAVLTLYPVLDRPSSAPTTPTPKACLAIARQVISAHGGRIESYLEDPEDPYIRIMVPSALRIRPMAEPAPRGSA